MPWAPRPLLFQHNTGEGHISCDGGEHRRYMTHARPAARCGATAADDSRAAQADKQSEPVDPRRGAPRCTLHDPRVHTSAPPSRTQRGSPPAREYKPCMPLLVRTARPRREGGACGAAAVGESGCPPPPSNSTVGTEHARPPLPTSLRGNRNGAPIYLSLRASRSHSSSMRMSPSRIGPFTLRTIERDGSSRNSTRTCVTWPV
jgi:hypothetical protein